MDISNWQWKVKLILNKYILYMKTALAKPGEWSLICTHLMVLELALGERASANVQPWVPLSHT